MNDLRAERLSLSLSPLTPSATTTTVLPLTTLNKQLLLPTRFHSQQLSTIISTGEIFLPSLVASLTASAAASSASSYAAAST